MGEKREWQFVLLVTECGRDLLEKRLVAAMRFEFVADPVCLLPQAELRRGIENAADAFFRQIFERGLTTSGSRQWNVCIECLWQSYRINADLRHVTVQMCAGEKRLIASLYKHVKDGRFEGWIGCVTVCFPAAIQQIDLDAPPNRLAAIYPNCSIPKVGTRFAVPSPELDDIDLVSGSANKMPAEIASKPARETRALPKTCVTFARALFIIRA